MHVFRLGSLAALCTATLLAQTPPTGFPTYAGMVAAMNTAATNYPGICELVDLNAAYGSPLTHGGNSLYALRISDNVSIEEDEPACMIVAAHHGNEYGTPIVALDAITRLTQGYGIDPVITALVDDNEIWIAPCWNPDSYWTTRTNGIGVDLNRNYPFLWSSACNTGAKGASPGSEPETQTMMAWSEAQRFTKVLDFHSSGRETLYGYRLACGQHVFGNFLAAEAAAISSASSYGGVTREPSSNGEQYQWQLGNFSNYAFLTEISNTQSPTIASAQAEANSVWPGTVLFLQREIPVWGHVTDAITGQPLVANITYVENPFTQGEQNRSEPLYGRYHAFLPAGLHTLRFSLAGYQTQDVPVTVTATGSVLADVTLTPPGLAFSYPLGLPTTVATAGGTSVRVDVSSAATTAQPNTGKLHLQSQNGSQTIAMNALGVNMYEAILPGFACGDTVQMRFSAEDTTGQEWQSLAVFAPTALQVNLISTDAFEVASGWVGGQPGDTATTGIWNRMDPNPTAAQPGDDHTVLGVNCWVTDGNGGTIGQFDIDGGFTTLMSPLLDFSSAPQASIRYWRWYSNNQNGVIDDVFRVDVSSDNGSNWVNVETIDAATGQASGGWYEHTFAVQSLVPPTSQVRIRFVAADLGAGSIVEAAIDDFEIFAVSCDGEVVRGGTGCSDSSGTNLRLLQTGAATRNGTISLAVEAGVVQPAFLLAGSNNTSWNGIALPVVLPGTGTPGCQVLISAEISIGLLPLGGALAVTLPSNPATVGLNVYWQAVLLDPGLTTPLPFATTDYLKTTIGS